MINFLHHEVCKMYDSLLPTMSKSKLEKIILQNTSSSNLVKDSVEKGQ